MALTAKEKMRRYREKMKADVEKRERIKEKDQQRKQLRKEMMSKKEQVREKLLNRGRVRAHRERKKLKDATSTLPPGEGTSKGTQESTQCSPMKVFKTYHQVKEHPRVLRRVLSVHE